MCWVHFVEQRLFLYWPIGFSNIFAQESLHVVRCYCLIHLSSFNQGDGGPCSGLDPSLTWAHFTPATPSGKTVSRPPTRRFHQQPRVSPKLPAVQSWITNSGTPNPVSALRTEETVHLNMDWAISSGISYTERKKDFLHKCVGEEAKEHGLWGMGAHTPLWLLSPTVASIASSLSHPEPHTGRVASRMPGREPDPELLTEASHVHTHQASYRQGNQAARNAREQVEVGLASSEYYF